MTLELRGAMLAILVLLASYGRSDQPRQASAQTITDCAPDQAAADRVRELLVAGLDAALEEQIIHVFLTWLKDDTRQPERARNGTRQAVNAYFKARVAAQRWVPVLCG